MEFKIYLFLVSLSLFINVIYCLPITFNSLSNCYIIGELCDISDANNWVNNTLPLDGDDILIDYSQVELINDRPSFVNLVALNNTYLSNVSFGSITLIGSDTIKTQLIIEQNISIKITNSLSIENNSTLTMYDYSKLMVNGQILIENSSVFNPSGITEIGSLLSISNSSVIGFSGNSTQLIVKNSFQLDQSSKFIVNEEALKLSTIEPFLFVDGSSCSLLGSLVIGLSSTNNLNTKYKLIQFSNQLILNGTAFNDNIEIEIDNQVQNDIRYKIEIESNILTVEFRGTKLPTWGILIIIISIFIAVGILAIIIYIINDRRKYYNRHIKNIYTPLL